MKKNSFITMCSLLFILSVITGCASTTTMKTVEPPLDCGECDESSTSFSESFGPVVLDGGVSLGNLSDLTTWWDEISDAAEEAGDKITEDIDAYDCDDGCSKEVDGKVTMTIETNPGGTEYSAECDQTVTKEIEVSGSSPSCALAQAAMMGEAMSAANGLDGICKKYGDECVAKSVDVDPNTIKTSQKSGPGTFSACIVKGSVTVTVDCAKDAGGGGGISNASASGVIDVAITCSAPKVCTDPGMAICIDSNGDGDSTATCFIEDFPVKIDCANSQTEVSCLSISSTEVTTIDDGTVMGAELEDPIQSLRVLDR
jgi:hypothetical protein